MAFDTYLLLDGGSKVQGEATASGLTPATGWIEISSFSWGASNPPTASATGSGLTAGKVKVTSFNVTKKADYSSNPLMTACCSGQTFATAQVVMRKAGGASGSQATFLQYDFKGVMVESIQWSGSAGGDDAPTESVSLAFASFTISYWKPSPSGMLTATDQATWNIIKNTAT